MSYDTFKDIKQLPDSNFILVGQTIGEKESDYWLVKTDKDGNELWNKTYNKDHNDILNSFTNTADG